MLAILFIYIVAIIFLVVVVGSIFMVLKAVIIGKTNPDQIIGNRDIYFQAIENTEEKVFQMRDRHIKVSRRKEKDMLRIEIKRLQNIRMHEVIAAKQQKKVDAYNAYEAEKAAKLKKKADKKQAKKDARK